MKRDEAGQKQVTLEWDSISCTITTKKGGTKEVLQDVSGEAKPGRYVHLSTCHSAESVLGEPLSMSCGGT